MITINEVVNSYQTCEFVLMNRGIMRQIGINQTLVLSELLSRLKYHAGRNELEKDQSFYCTAEKLEELTTLGYKAQTLAIKGLEAMGLIRVVRKTGNKRYFIVVLDAVKDLIEKFSKPVQPKEEKLNKEDKHDKPSQNEKPGVAEKENPELPKGENSNNKKNLNKNNKKYIINNLLTREDIANELILEYMKKGLPKQVCLMVLKEVENKPHIKNFGGYLNTCLGNALRHRKVKRGLINISEKFNAMMEGSNIPLYDWLSS